MFKKVSAIVAVVVFIALGFMCFKRQQLNSKFTESLATKYSVKDYTISDFIVTDARFGAKAQKGFDNTKAFQTAIDAAYEAGGGVVYIPAGNYEFHSAQKAVKNVRIRKGESEIRQDFDYEYVLKLPTGVQLRGEWADPKTNGGKVEGTVLEVYAGKNSPNADRNVSSWWNDAQDGNKLRTSYTSVADRFIEMSAATGVMNLSIWYPEQDINNVSPYPWTLFQTGGDGANVERVTLVNAYNGFYSAPSELHYVLDSYMTALNKGLEIHVCTDIGRVENVKVGPSYWAKSGLKGAPSEDDIVAYTKKHATGFKMHRSDWEYISYLDVKGCQTGLWIGKEPGFDNAPNAQLYGISIDNCANGLYVEDVNPYGILVSNSTISANKGDHSVYFHPDFDTSVQFNGVDFKGKIFSEGSGGVVSFESCNFNEMDDCSMEINNGNVLCSQCSFKAPANHVVLGKNGKSFKAVNSGCNKKLDVRKGNASAKVEVVFDDKYKFTPIPKNIRTGVKKHPMPFTNKVYRAELAKAVGYNNDRPSVDVSKDLQDALNDVASVGGGTLYLPSGRYLVEQPVTIPSGVELRGSWDMPHHTLGGGTILFTNYDGGEKGENGPSLIQLEKSAGIKGLSIAQLNIAPDGSDIEHPLKTPFLIQGKGSDVYVVNVTIPLGDKGIDLATYNTSRHYVEYLGGVLLRAGIWVGGGAEGGTIRNMQFNPHYGLRLPPGKQGYPSAAGYKFVQSYCSALKFADVKDQVIFNNFVFGSVYGVHFLKDKITGKCPGQIQMIGHGSDGCTYSLFVEDADKDTKIIGVNSELVNTKITHEPVRSYVLMGKEEGTKNIDPESELVLYNSAFWGHPIMGAIINNGKVSIQQGNYHKCGNPGMSVRKGELNIFTTYFAQEKNKADAEDVYVKVAEGAKSVNLTNNFFQSGLQYSVPEKFNLTGTDVK